MDKKQKALSLVEAVRKRPGMYFGDIEEDGVNNIIYEIVANSVDQFLAGLADTISIRIDNKTITISDNGPGLPFDQKAPQDENLSLVEYYLTNRHDSPTADSHAPHIHILTGGLGIAVVNAASVSLIIESSDGHQLSIQEFGKGKILSKVVCTKSNRPSGVKLEVTLDPEIFTDSVANMDELRKTMFELIHLYPGLTIELNNERFYSKAGLLDLAYFYYQKPAFYYRAAKKFHFQGKKNDVQIQVAAIGDTEGETEYRSWVNGRESLNGGTHVKGLNEVFKTVNWKPKVALIHAILHDPRFAGPTKDALASPEIIGDIQDILGEPLKNFIACDG